MINPAEFIDPDMPSYYVSSTGISGIFARQFIETLTMSGIKPVFTIAESDAPANGSVHTIDSVAYTVREIQPDGNGFAALIMEEN